MDEVDADVREEVEFAACGGCCGTEGGGGGEDRVEIYALFFLVL